MLIAQVLLAALACGAVSVFFITDDVESLTRAQCIKAIAGCTACWSGILLICFLIIEAW